MRLPGIDCPDFASIRNCFLKLYYQTFVFGRQAQIKLFELPNLVTIRIYFLILHKYYGLATIIGNPHFFILQLQSDNFRTQVFIFNFEFKNSLFEWFFFIFNQKQLLFQTFYLTFHNFYFLWSYLKLALHHHHVGNELLVSCCGVFNAFYVFHCPTFCHWIAQDWHFSLLVVLNSVVYLIPKHNILLLQLHILQVQRILFDNFRLRFWAEHLLGLCSF